MKQEVRLVNNKPFPGLVAFVHGITEEEIVNTIDAYRGFFPDDKRTDDELQVSAINTILANRDKVSIVNVTKVLSTDECPVTIATMFLLKNKT